MKSCTTIITKLIEHYATATSLKKNRNIRLYGIEIFVNYSGLPSIK
jgi:hypothetical protein